MSKQVTKKIECPLCGHTGVLHGTPCPDCEGKGSRKITFTLFSRRKIIPGLKEVFKYIGPRNLKVSIPYGEFLKGRRF